MNNPNSAHVRNGLRRTKVTPTRRPGAGAVIGLSCALALIAGCQSGPGPEPLADVPLDEVAIVGSASGDLDQGFGQILDVSPAADGSFFVLDARGPAVSWYAPDGALRGRIDASGQGSGGLASAAALAVGGSGRVTVLDAENGRIAYYSPGEDAIEYERAISHPRSTYHAGGRTICELDDRLYVRELRGDWLVHELGPDGEILRSFDAAHPTAEEEFGSFAEIVAPQRNAGLLLCLEDPGMIVSMSRFLPVIRAFTPDGALLWEAEIAAFRPWHIAASPEGGVDFRADPLNGSHHGVAISRWDRTNLLVQYAVSPQPGTPEDRDFFGLESRVVSLASGRDIGWLDGLPLIAGTAGELLYSYENLPSPRVRVLRRRE